MRRPNSVNSIVVVSDIHSGCKLGLCPHDGLKYDEGGLYMPSVLQQRVYDKWEEFWHGWVPSVTKDEWFDVVVNGDSIDGVHHKSSTQITHNLKDQKALAVDILGKIVAIPRCRRIYIIRGTASHVGTSAESEEEIAKEVGAHPDEHGNYSRWELWARMDKALIHFSHHMGTTGSSAYESTAVYKELVEAYTAAGRWEDEPPDCVVRSHRHRAFMITVPTKKGLGISLVTPGWQLKTPYTHRIPSARADTPQVGGAVIRTGDEDEIYARFKVWKMDRPREVVV